MNDMARSPVEMVLDEIDRDECIELLRTQSVGRTGRRPAPRRPGDGQVFDVACTLGGLLTCDIAAMYGTGAPFPSATGRRLPEGVALTSAV